MKTDTNGKKRAGCLVFFFLCLFSDSGHGLYPQSIPSDKKYRKISSEHFTLVYYTTPVRAARILKTAENVHHSLAGKFGIRGSLHTTIVLVDTQDEANGMATILPANVMILYDTVPDTASQPSLLNYYSHMEELIIHEYTHILVLNQTYFPLKKLGFPYVAVNALLPLSAQEGIAVYTESAYTPMGRVKSSYKEMLLRTAVYEDRVPGLDEISVFANRIPSGEGPYIWGGAFHQYMAEQIHEENMLDAYKAHANCSCTAVRFRPLTCLSSCLTFSPLNSVMDYYTGLSYYELYDDWVSGLKDHYAKKIREIKDPTPALEICPEERFWQIYDMAVYKSKVYFSAYSPHMGCGLYQYDPGTKGFRRVVSDALITSLALYRDRIYFTRAEYRDNVYFYYCLGFYDLRSKKTGQIKNVRRALSVRRADKKLIIVENGENAKTVNTFVPETGKEEIILKLDKYDQVSGFTAVQSNEFYFIMKKENDFSDIYLYRADQKALSRLTRNSALEQNLTVWDKRLYFISDPDSVFNLYEYNPDKKQFFRKTDFISGAMRFTASGTNLYFSLFGSGGYALASLAKDQLKHVPVLYTALTNSGNFRPPSSPLLSEEVNISGERRFHPLLDMLTHFMILPAGETLGPEGFGSIGAALIFSDVFFRNQLTLQADYFLAPVNKPNFLGEYTYDGNRYRYTLSLARFHTGYTNSVSRDDSVFFSFSYLKNRLFQYLQLVTALNYYKRTHTRTGRVTAYHALAQGFYYNSAKQYRYSIMPEKGVFFYPQYIMMKRFLGSSWNLDLLHLDFTLYQRMLFRHQVLKLDLSSGVMLNGSSGTPYSVTGSLVRPYADAVYDVGLEGYAGYEADFKNYFKTRVSYNIPLVWVERGIRNMPFFLRNIQLNCYFTAGNGFNNPAGMRLLKGAGNELTCSFYVYYEIPSDLTAGYLYELDRDRQWYYYIRWNYGF